MFQKSDLNVSDASGAEIYDIEIYGTKDNEVNDNNTDDNIIYKFEYNNATKSFDSNVGPTETMSDNVRAWIPIETEITDTTEFTWNIHKSLRR